MKDKRKIYDKTIIVHVIEMLNEKPWMTLAELKANIPINCNPSSISGAISRLRSLDELEKMKDEETGCWRYRYIDIEQEPRPSYALLTKAWAGKVESDVIAPRWY